MANGITEVSKSELAAENESLMRRMQRTKEKMNKNERRAAMIVEVIVGGGLAGFIRGRYSDKMILGFEADGVLGACLLIGAWWVGDTYADDLMQLGAGFAAAYAAFEMKSFGEKMLAESKKGSPQPGQKAA